MNLDQFVLLFISHVVVNSEHAVLSRVASLSSRSQSYWVLMNRDQGRSVVIASRTGFLYNRIGIVHQSCKVVEKLDRDRFPRPF